MKRLIFAALGTVLGCAPAIADDSAADTNASDRTVTITYTNLTGGQVFSPAVFFSHNASAPPLFTEGQPAPFALQRIAEEGNTGPLLSGKITRCSAERTNMQSIPSRFSPARAERSRFAFRPSIR
jgi:hypothetical protein